MPLEIHSHIRMKFLILIVIYLTFIGSVNALTCYNNVMADNSNEDDVNEHCETTLNTTTDLVRCKKHTSAHGEVRQCETTWLCPWNGCMKNTYKYDKIVCCCDEDFCNSATNGPPPPEKSCVEKCKTDHPDELAEYTECYCKCEDTGKDCSGTNTFKGNLILTTATFIMIYQLIR